MDLITFSYCFAKPFCLIFLPTTFCPVLVYCIRVGNQEDKLGTVCSMHGEMRNAYKSLIRKLKGGDHLGDFGLGGRVLLQ